MHRVCKQTQRIYVLCIINNKWRIKSLIGEKVIESILYEVLLSQIL